VAADRCARQQAPELVALPERVTFGDFWRALGAQVDSLDSTPREAAFRELATNHRLDPETPGLRHDFLRLWSLFEATRDGGWWRLRWKVTDQEPTSKEIWKAWQRTLPEARFDAPSAVAECDEISALFSVTARRLGVRGVGLFYPTWNHVIAGWTPQALAGRSDRSGVVLVPTTQIFLGCQDTFDRTSFAAPKRVYEFPKVDMKDTSELDPALATFLLEQVVAYGEATSDLLALIRTKRAELLGSSVGDCGKFRRELATRLLPQLSCADQRALRHLASQELARPDASTAELLDWLAS
jgi:hypothetical protein